MSIVGAAKVETLKGALAQAKKEAEANKAAANKVVVNWRPSRSPAVVMKLGWPKSSKSCKMPSASVRLWRRRLRPSPLSLPRLSVMPKRHGASPGALAKRPSKRGR